MRFFCWYLLHFRIFLSFSSLTGRENKLNQDVSWWGGSWLSTRFLLADFIILGLHLGISFEDHHLIKVDRRHGVWWSLGCSLCGSDLPSGHPRPDRLDPLLLWVPGDILYTELLRGWQEKKTAYSQSPQCPPQSHHKHWQGSHRHPNMCVMYPNTIGCAHFSEHKVN